MNGRKNGTKGERQTLGDQANPPNGRGCFELLHLGLIYETGPQVLDNFIKALLVGPLDGEGALDILDPEIGAPFYQGFHHMKVSIVAGTVEGCEKRGKKTKRKKKKKVKMANKATLNNKSRLRV